MRIDVITIFPQMVEAVAQYGIPARAAEGGLLELHCWNPRDYTRDSHRSVDDRPYGGGPGMVMRVEPLREAIRTARRQAGNDARTIYLSPQGRRLEQAILNEWATREALILVAGRYEGVDERLIELEIDEEWSLGDYVLSGGELAAMAVIDALARLQPGALGDAASAGQDSFMRGLLDCPHYTRPETVAGLKAPAALLTGDHAAIRRWRLKQALGRTWRRRPELLDRLRLNDEERRLLEEFVGEHEAQASSRNKR